MTIACAKQLNTMNPNNATNTDMPAPAIAAALRDNAECRLGILAQQRIALLDKGINSYQQDKELLALISDQGNWWYGYVLRTGPMSPFDTAGGEWLALLVQSGVPIDGYSQEEVFRCVQKSWFKLLEYHPYFIQQPEDGMAQCHTFEQAVLALGHIIRRFDIKKRIAWEWGDRGNLLDPPNSELDRRCVDLFGLRYDTQLLHDPCHKGYSP